MVEGARLESVYTGNRIAGSNPALSASSFSSFSTQRRTARNGRYFRALKVSRASLSRAPQKIWASQTPDSRLGPALLRFLSTTAVDEFWAQIGPSLPGAGRRCWPVADIWKVSSRGGAMRSPAKRSEMALTTSGNVGMGGFSLSIIGHRRSSPLAYPRRSGSRTGELARLADPENVVRASRMCAAADADARCFCFRSLLLT